MCVCVILLSISHYHFVGSDVKKFVCYVLNGNYSHSILGAVFSSFCAAQYYNTCIRAWVGSVAYSILSSTSLKFTCIKILIVCHVSYTVLVLNWKFMVDYVELLYYYIRYMRQKQKHSA